MNKLPEECQNITEVRTQIDRIDREIITKLSERYNYVKVASKFKTSETNVQAPARFKSMLEDRRNWATSAGLNPDVIAKMYEDLVTYFIQEELQHWNSNL